MGQQGRSCLGHADAVCREYLDAFDEPEEFLRRESELVARMRSVDVSRMMSAFVDALHKTAGARRLGAASAILYLERESGRRIAASAATEASLAFADALKTNSADLQGIAASLLTYHGEVPEQAKKPLIRLLKAEDMLVRTASAAALCSTNARRLRIVTILGAALASKNAGLQAFAAVGLPRLGLNASDVVKESLGTLGKAKPEGVRALVGALNRIPRIARELVPLLASLLADDRLDVELRSSIATSLGEVGGESKEAMQALASALRHSDWQIVLSAAIALSSANAKSQFEAMTFLIKLLDSDDRNLRGSAAAGLQEFGKQLKRAVPALVSRLLKERDEEILEEVIRTLMSAGNAAFPELLRELTRCDVSGRHVIGLALLHVGQDATADMARAMLESEHRAVRECLASVLYRLGPRAVDAVPTLIKMIERGDADVKHDAIVALAAVGADARAATATLIGAFDTVDEETVAWVEKALFSIGSEALPLIRASRGEGSDRRRACLERVGERLGALDPASKGDAFGWLADDRLIELFVIVAGLVSGNKKPMGGKALSQALMKMREMGALPHRISVSPGYIRKSLRALEDLLTQESGRTIHLFERKRNAAGRLTSDGHDFLERALSYLKATRMGAAGSSDR